MLREALLSEVTAQSETIIVAPSMTVAKALERMRAKAALGTILVENAQHGIAGIVTEHDLVSRVSRHSDLETITIGEIMTPDPEVLRTSDSVAHAINIMGARGSRRVPIVGESGTMVLTVDDVLDFVRQA